MGLVGLQVREGDGRNRVGFSMGSAEGLKSVRRDDSSRVLIGAAGRSRSDWRRRSVGTLIGQSACRL